MLAELGGLFAIMTLVHFAFDWLTQSEYDAVRKQYDWVIRFKHCFLYSLLMMLAFAFVPSVSVFKAWMIFNWLFTTHFIEDTYWFPLWWMRTVRQPTKGAYEGFNLILVVVADQVVHLLCLLVACWIAL